jgi:hypothetical protein
MRTERHAAVLASFESVDLRPASPAMSWLPLRLPEDNEQNVNLVRYRTDRHSLFFRPGLFEIML